MPKTPLTKDSEFIVGEEKMLVYILAALFFAIFLYGVVEAFNYGLSKLTWVNYMYAIALVPAIFFFIKGTSGRIFIRVNKTGIYQDEKLVTDWKNFINAYITQKQKLMSIQDNFILVVEYLKDSSGTGFRRNIPLSNTQNKSEEDVLEAVLFFWKRFGSDIHEI